MKKKITWNVCQMDSILSKKKILTRLIDVFANFENFVFVLKL